MRDEREKLQVICRIFILIVGLAFLLFSLLTDKTYAGIAEETDMIGQEQSQENLERIVQGLSELNKDEEQLAVVEKARTQSASRGGNRGRQIYLEASAYTCGPESTGKYASDPDYCKTASGYRLQPGDKAVAMGPRYPFGTLVMIPGYGLATVRDRGGAIGDNQIDLYFEHLVDALKWGRRKVTVTIM